MKRERDSKLWWVNKCWQGEWPGHEEQDLGKAGQREKAELMVAAFFQRPLTQGVNLSLIQYSRLFGCDYFSSVSCRKTHRLRLKPGLHHSCGTLISGTHASLAAQAHACCLVSSPAGPWFFSCCSSGTANNCGSLVVLEMGPLQCCLGGLQCPVLISAHFSEPGWICHLGVWESKLSREFVIVNLGFATRLSIVLLVCVTLSFICSLQSPVYSLLSHLRIRVFNSKIVLQVGLAYMPNFLLPVCWFFLGQSSCLFYCD